MLETPPNVIRILYRRPNQRVLGPLGCFEVGQHVIVENLNHVVCSIDPDGAGVAYSQEYLRQRCTDEDCTPRQMMNKLAGVRSWPCYGLDMAGPSAQAGMLAQQERNRREYCQ